MDTSTPTRIIDFATPLEGENLHLTQTGKLLGTPLYMSPEQAQGAKDIDARTDIWSIGAVLYETLTGQSPFADADNLGTLILAICSQPPPPCWTSSRPAGRTFSTAFRCHQNGKPPGSFPRSYPRIRRSSRPRRVPRSVSPLGDAG